MADRGVDVSALPKEARDQLAELDLELSALTDCSMMASGKVSPAQPTGGRRRRTVDDDPDDRRQRFLERNRAAASRCRQKRKLWVSSLEKKAEELNSMNVSLATVTDTSCVKQKLHRRPTCQYWALPATTGPTARPWCPGC